MPQLNRLKRPPVDNWPFERELLFPKGLFGFEKYTHYRLIGHEREVPFLRLESVENPNLSFFVADPFLYYPSYEPTLTHNDLKDVGILNEGKLLLFAIVDRDRRPQTMNLGAPLLIHWHKKLGKQLLFPENSEFPLDDF